LGGGSPEGHLRNLGDTLGQWVHENTDFRAAFSKVGKSVSDGEPAVQTFGLLWSEIFGNHSDKAEAEGMSTTEGEGGNLPGETTILPGVGEEAQAAGEGSGGQQQNAQDPAQQPAAETKPQPPASETKTPEAPAQAGTEKTSATTKLMDGEVVTPVMGVITSGFGYRTHPIDGEWKEHEGIDIMADEGTPIKAFASGTVDYVGESPAYGMYLQLKHDNGVTSFYAHCSALLVKKGADSQGGRCGG